MAENAFGILSNRFRFLHTVVHAEPRRVASLLKAACVLHNFLNAEPADVPETGVGNTEQTIFPMLPCKVRYNSKAAHVRDELRTYFSGAGAIPWQSESSFVTTKKYKMVIPK